MIKGERMNIQENPKVNLYAHLPNLHLEDTYKTFGIEADIEELIPPLGVI